MFNLENEIAQWRQELRHVGIKRSQVLDELETHLREQFATLVRSGMNEQEAFRTAASNLGNADSLKREFEKLKHNPGAAGKIVLAAWSMLMVVIAWFVAMKPPADLLLAAHVVTLTGGYLAAFVSGGFAICQVLLTLLGALDGKSFTRTIVLFNRIAVALVGVGVVLGTFWEKSHSGQFLSGNAQAIQIGLISVLLWNVKQLGAVCAFLFVGTIALLEWRDRIRDHNLLLAVISGNVVVDLAWFGAGALDSQLLHYGVGYGWWLCTVVVHLVILLLGIVSRRQMTWKKHDCEPG